MGKTIHDIKEYKHKVNSQRRKIYLKIKRLVKLQPKSISQIKELISKSVMIRVPIKFSITDNTEETISFLNSLKEVKSNRRRIYFSLSKVEIITEGAIAILVSIIKELVIKNYKCAGSKPKNKEARKILERSGFFNHVNGVIDSENKKTMNTIITEGEKAIDQVATSKIVRSSIKFLTGKSDKNTKLQGLFIEMMANAINHGFPKELKKRWILSSSNNEYNNEKKSCFTFIDNGVGVLETLEVKLVKQIIITIFKDKSDLLLSAFKGEIGSRTKEPYRGRGLPFIHNCLLNNTISNLFILTNNVILDFKNQKFIQINTNYSGTFYYFELSIKNLNNG